MAHAMTEAQLRARYRAGRYMADISDADLHQRRKDISRNFMTINADGKLSPLVANHRLRVFWHGRFLDLLEEYILRFGPYPRGFETLSFAEIGFPDPRSARIRAAMSAMAGRRFEDGKYLVKYGKRAHLQDMLRTGTVRITPASLLADTSFSDAIRDTELTMSRWLHQPRLGQIYPNLEPPVRDLVVDGSVVTSRTSEDFYLFCLSASYDACLFDDFNADACVIIHDPVAFRDQLVWQAHRALSARGHVFGAVTYVDPITQGAIDIPIAMQKDARYSYQDEVRGAWLPQSGVTDLRVTYVRVGNLEGIAELIEIE